MVRVLALDDDRSTASALTRTGRGDAPGIAPGIVPADPSGPSTPCPFDRAVADHDAAVASLGLDVWLGNEPTFTDRRSFAAEWVTGALGPDKRLRASRVLAHLAGAQPGCAVLRSLGRRYPGEETPRWSFGIYARRDGLPAWAGCPDPLLAGTPAQVDLHVLQEGLAVALARRGFAHRAFAREVDWRVVFATGREVVLPDPGDERLTRPSLPLASFPPAGPRDDLASDGAYLLIVSSVIESGIVVPSIELPAIADVGLFLELLGVVSEATACCGATSVVLCGFPPPVDDTVAYATVTPDPAVVEVNMAPHRSVAAFLADNRRCYAAAAAVGLDPYRLLFNGAVADSGGGGQITFGGPSPARSPFFLVPELLPRLIRYVVRHPALSYLFAHDFVGPSGQSVRPDEHNMDAFRELELALALLDRQEQLDPATLWRSLAPSLTDPIGNSHRAEINIEKLWNPWQPGRGQLGLVEFRAFRMQHTPERAAALAALFRAVLAMLMTGDPRLELVDWGSALHERFALPFYLDADLRDVMTDLDTARVGLATELRDELEADPVRPWGVVEFGGCSLSIRRGVEFWPIVGDASQQQGTSRLVDSSTSRIEVALRPSSPGDARALEALRLQANGFEVPLRTESDPRGPVRVSGLRYRSFVPTIGLHPTLGAQTPVRLALVHPDRAEALEISLHEWRPDGEPYAGVPDDLAQATSRRAARCLVRAARAVDLAPAREAPVRALNGYCLDLRYE
jgi:uncharacterized protein (DUF2126 family)